MTFTYNPATNPDDVTLVRYYIGDRTEATAWWTDAEINMILTQEGSVGKAAISLLDRMITEISQEPDLKADWLATNWGGSVRALERQAATLRNKFNVALRSGGTVTTYRSDSDQTEAPSDW